MTTAARAQALPDIPTVGESVEGYEASAAYGLGAPSSTPVEIIAMLNKESNAALADARMAGAACRAERRCASGLSR